MPDRRGFMKLLGMGAAGAATTALPVKATPPAGVAAEIQDSCPSCRRPMRHSRLNSTDPVDVMHFCDHCGFIMVLPVMSSEQVMQLKQGFVKPLIKKRVSWIGE